MTNPPGLDGKRPRIRMLIPLWGAAYFERWIDIPAAALRSKGNIPYLQEHADFELVFLTKSQDLNFVAEKIMPQLGGDIRVKTVTIDEFFPKRGSVTYGVPLTMAFIKGVQDLGPEGLGTYVIFMNADFVLSDGSLAKLFEAIEQGCHVITAPSIRVVDHAVRDTLSSHRRSRSADEGFSARYLMSLTHEHLHQTVLSRLINEPCVIEAWYYHLVYWRVSKTCIAARYFLLMPLCFQLRRQVATANCPIDYGFLEQACPGGRYTALCDSDDFLMVELQEQESEATLIMPARDASSRGDALEQKLSQIVENASGWNTSEHRRAIQHTLLFHSQDITADDRKSIAEFDSRMSQAIDRLPPPLAWQRHPHWLGAVRHYRAAMFNGDTPCPDLLSDESNRIGVTLFAADITRIPPPIRKCPIDLSDYFSSASVIVTLGLLSSEIAESVPTALLYPAKLEDAHDHDLEMDISLYEGPKFAPGQRLGIYLLMDSLPHWPKFRSLCDSALDAGAEVVLMFRNTDWVEVPYEGHTWILSRLSYYFSSEKYYGQVKFISATKDDEDQSGTAGVAAQIQAGSVSPLNLKKFSGFAIRLAGSHSPAVAK